MSKNYIFSAAVAEFGMILRRSDYASDANYKQVLQLAKLGKGQDKEGYRQEFISMVESCQLMDSEFSKK